VTEVTAKFNAKDDSFWGNLRVQLSLLLRSLPWHRQAPEILFLFSVLVAAGHAQISPGPLSNAHKSISGPTQCTECHKVAAGSASFKCLECHTEIASRINTNHGLHASFGRMADTGKDCARCHSEHNGENFSLIQWNPAPSSFDHSKTGYLLQGKHAGLDCRRCHSPQHVVVAERPILVTKDINRTFLGASRTCNACHEDKHQGRLRQDCQQCHTFEDWKMVSVAKTQFDHSKTRYPLTGLHEKVACERCHTPGNDGRPKYVGLRFDTCSACHSDPHRGSFAGACQSCHNTEAWKRVSVAALSDKFDHSKTAYPLLGKHASVGCEGCHADADFKKPIAFQKCSNCHNPDPHSGQFVKRADHGECSGCHTVEGFKPAHFGLNEHAATAYPLLGKHASVGGAKCHIPAGTATLYKIKFAACTDCHKDEHQGQFAAAPYFNRCERCHDLKGYHPSRFTLANHKNTRFPLTGGHMATPCGECHKKEATVGSMKSVVLFRFDERSCTVCHEDPHRGQFKTRMVRLRADGNAAGCETCHNSKSWSDIARFDHSATDFQLLGAHRAIACIGCHKPPNLETSLKNVDFKAAPKLCEDCHQDAHAGQFAKLVPQRACANCHNSNKWKPSLFDHDAKTGFPLQGAHKNVACSGCHKNFKLIDDKRVLFYKPTPTNCSDCHGSSVKSLEVSKTDRLLKFTTM